ncbi:short chain dehydrogenase [Pyrenophora seminiperda CCB06]|uniref:Short chain dehydrogenase n=1 Tax=Pyrenophora seminiperda CCB06 TaxID=1302712 RepID=A0A3M7M2E9_9PLEO|nr:short chain dehydrogenase [Pyrenophora seminiperda CCB06]
MGVSKGIGFEFMKQISSDAQNLVIGLVRDTQATEKKAVAEFGALRENIRLVQADLGSHASLKRAAETAAGIVGDAGVDVLVANAGLVSYFDGFKPIGDLAGKPDELEKCASELFQINVVGNVHLFHAFLPLLLKSNTQTKRVITLTSGVADLDLTNDFDLDIGALYAASKAAMNMVIAKFSVQYKYQGVLFMGISPGVVEVGHYDTVSEDEMKGMVAFVEKLKKYAPDFAGPISTEESVRRMREVWEKATIEKDAGAFVSHLGNKKWV